MQAHNIKRPLLHYVIAGFASVLAWNLALLVYYHLAGERPASPRLWITIVMYAIIVGALTMIGGLVGLALGAIDRRFTRPSLWTKSVVGFVLYDLAWWPLANSTRLLDHEIDLALAAAAGALFAWLVVRQGARA